MPKLESSRAGAQVGCSEADNADHCLASQIPSLQGLLSRDPTSVAGNMGPCGSVLCAPVARRAQPEPATSLIFGQYFLCLGSRKPCTRLSSGSCQHLSSTPMPGAAGCGEWRLLCPTGSNNESIFCVQGPPEKNVQWNVMIFSSELASPHSRAQVLKQEHTL